MSVPATQPFIPVEDYLAGERDGEIRHEYVAGRIYAMTGGSVYHNRIALALASYLRSRIPAGCNVFMADMKVQTLHAFYYPDVMVHRDPDDTKPYTKHRPLLIAEVISPNTRSSDEREKRTTYLGQDIAMQHLYEGAWR